MAGLAYRLDVAEVEESRLVALVRFPMVGHRSARVVPVSLYDDAVAALAGVEIAKEGLLPDAVRAAPAGISVELAVLLGLGRAGMVTLLPFTYAGRAMDWWLARHPLRRLALCQRLGESLVTRF